MSVVRKQLTIAAPPERVWRYLESADLLAAWLMRNNFEPVAGREFQFFAAPRGSWDGVVQCRVVEIEPPHRLSFTWNANDIGADTLVTIALQAEGSATRLELIHTNFAGAVGDIEALVRRHDAGWADHLHVLSIQAEEEAGGARAAPPVDWTSFDLHVAIAASPERVLAAWSSSAGMESFFVEMMRITGPDGRERGAHERARPGDRFVWRWHNGRRLEGHYLVTADSSEQCFSFGDSRISVRAVPYGDGCLLRLRQYDIPEGEEARMSVHANCRGGWVYFLTALKALMEHGIDVRDTSRETGASFSFYFDPEAVGAQGLTR